ncbi:Gfo/Idh/MocA family oxidoreductase [Erysipelothrix sp. HDW6C]|uniref:Gfo/Idh/MocA family protein n=1 Tax=Erysipelothrix sp. HDW6C TaxID=2714930 RepID=UPI001408DE74|nr:Gfo/Idh/MocA family oxidoreductase [Erysipelothrix sp. HDW6C]QIK69055.1 Gfo/Idh/MocA family oxidoreductase [Erysipelothrix sp. HDW6C]
MRIATIGSGFIVKEFINAGREIAGVDFVAAYSRTAAGARAFADEMGIEKSYDALDVMFADADIDFIYIASPNSLHYHQTMQALEAGKHVIVEKPFAGNEARAKEMIALAKAKNLMLFEAICNIHMPHFDYIKSQLERIGRIRAIQCNFSQYSSRYPQLLDHVITNVFDPSFSGGAMADINIYNIHFVVGLFGSPNQVSYIANQYENGIDTSGILTMKYDDFVVECVGAKDSFSFNFGQIQGEKGYIMVPESVSLIKSVEIVTKDAKIDYNIQDKHRLSYQIAAFKEISDAQDFAKRDALFEHSLAVVRVAEAARKCIDLNFEF